jgi:hypothetical protein
MVMVIVVRILGTVVKEIAFLSILGLPVGVVLILRHDERYERYRMDDWIVPYPPNSEFSNYGINRLRVLI